MAGLNEFALILSIVVIVSMFLIGYFVFSKKPQQNEQESSATQNEIETKESKAKSTTKQQPKQQKTALKPQTKTKEANFKHSWLLTTLKAHGDTISSIDFSSNGKYLISTGIDRAIFIWTVKDFDQIQHKNARYNVEFDYANKIKFSPDSKSFIVSLGVSNCVRVYKMTKKDDNSHVQITQAAIADFANTHKSEIINIGISCNGKFIMTCSKDTIINVWDLKGELMGSVDTRLMNNSYAAISTCGRFFGAVGFTPDCKIWEVVFDKAGNYREIKRAFELKGHSAGVTHFSYNADTTKMVTVSKDQTWKLWNTNIEYSKGQEASCILTVKLESPAQNYLIALSPDSYSVCVSADNNLYFYNGFTGKLDNKIENVFVDYAIELQYSNDNKYLAIAGDRNVKVFHNITGFKVAIEDSTSKLKEAKTESAKQRIQTVIDEYKELIKNATTNEQ